MEDKEVKSEEPIIEQPVVTPMESASASTPDKDTLSSILERMAALEEDNATLRQAVNQGKLIEAENAKKPVGNPIAYLKVLNGKVVTSWKSEKPKYLYNPSNPEAPIGEILQATYFFIDETSSGPIDQVEFTRNGDKVEAEVVEGLKGLKDPDVKEVTLHFTKLVTTDEEIQSKFVLPADLKINKNFLNP